MSPRDLPVLLTQHRDYKYTPTTMPKCLRGFWGTTQVPILRPYTRLFFRGHTFLSGLTEEVFSDLFLVIRKIFNCKKENSLGVLYNRPSLFSYLSAISMSIGETEAQGCQQGG